MEQTNTYLKTVPFTDFLLWDVKRYNYIFNSNFDNAVFLRDVLKPYKEKLSKEELIENDWRIIKKINFQGELFLRDKEEVESYKGSLNKVPDNSIIYSKINVRHGCIYYHKIGEVPFGVSSEYPTFTFNESKVDGKYLMLVLRSNEFKRLLNTKASGISKARVKVDEFLGIKIPLPPIEEQNRIVVEYNQKIQLAQQQEKEANNLEQEIESYITKKLGVIKPLKNQRESNLYFTNYDELSRWDYWVNSTVPKSEIYKNDVLESVVIGKPQYGANVKGVKKESDTRYIRITDINESGYLNNVFVSPASVDEKYLLKENDFLIARSGNTVGKTLLFKKKYGRAIYAGYLVRYIIDSSKIIPEYLFLFTKSFIFKEWISANQRVSGQPNINGQEFLKSPIVIPPINIQSEIVNKISILKEEIKDLRNEAIKNKENALLNFEQEIFNS